jgi:hypothetical protein
MLCSGTGSREQQIMSNITTFFAQETTVRLMARHGDREAPIAPAAWTLYRRAYAGGWIGKWWTGFTGQGTTLLELTHIEATGTVHNRHALGLLTVPIADIRGSENRCTDFDADFHPVQRHTEARWLSVATAWYRDIVLPPIDLVQVGDIFFVRDGHHRVSVARALGQIHIDAYVTVCQVIPR